MIYEGIWRLVVEVGVLIRAGCRFRGCCDKKSPASSKSWSMGGVTVPWVKFIAQNLKVGDAAKKFLQKKVEL